MSEIKQNELTAIQAAKMLQTWSSMPEYVPTAEDRELLFSAASRLLFRSVEENLHIRILCSQALEPLKHFSAGGYAPGVHDGRAAFARDILGVLEKEAPWTA